MRIVSAIVLALTLTPQARPADSGIELFEKKIRPVLVQHCYQCHSEDARRAGKLKGALLLDTRAGLLKGGDSGPALVPGKPDVSPLVKGLRYSDELQMPPKGKLPAAVVADFEAWIKLGAPDPRDGQAVGKSPGIDVEAGRRHWAFRPLTAVTPPRVKNEPWVRTPVDRFVLALLEEKGLAPSLPLGRERFIRRAAYDLTGLPPAPDEVDAFVKDPRPDAYERLIDRLLDSERYGERWARHWLDLVRFAESGGYEFDKDRPGAYQYRDFVIRSLNADRPYDEFVRLQIAGEHLRPDDLEASAATGLLVAGPYPGQTTAKTIEPIRYDHLDDMASTLGTALLGLSVGCARCHDHKFDPIPTRDYYHLIANLARTDSAELKLDPNPDATRKAKAAFDKVHAPFVAARDRFEKDELPGRLDKWLTANKGKPAPRWLVLDPVSVTAKAPVKKNADGSFPAARGDTCTVVAHTLHKGVTALRVDEQAELTLTAAPLDPKRKAVKPTPVKLKPGRATAGQPTVFEAEKPLGFDGGTVLTATLKFGKEFAGGPVRLALTTSTPADPAGDTALQHARELLTAHGSGSRAQVARWFRAFDPRTDEVLAAVEKSALAEPKPALVPVFAARDGRGGDVYHLTRGETDKKNGVAKPGFLQVLSSAPAAGASPPRVALAQWLTDSRQGAGPLLARVIVNRLWQHHLGKGLVRTPNDFGTQGEAPTHPELLDYLASELIRGGWKLKPIHKLIMTSAVYTQSGAPSEAAMKVDPHNRLWWRVTPRRLEAEAVRDAVLAVGGSLDRTMYGPGTLDESNPRRSVYLTVKRSRLPALLQAFDAPEAIQSVGERQTTTVATQALAMMNSRFVRAQAEKLAGRVKPAGAADLPRAVESAFLLALSRRPTTAERERAVAFVGRHAVKDQGEALADFCQVLLCASEFVYVD